MDGLSTTLGIVGALAFVLGAVLYAALAAAWRMLRDDSNLRLGRMLRRQGVPPEALAEAGYSGTIATRRCMACAEKEECDRWLASGSRGSIAAFCPNAAFIERVKDRSRS